MAILDILSSLASLQTKKFRMYSEISLFYKSTYTGTMEGLLVTGEFQKRLRLQLEIDSSIFMMFFLLRILLNYNFLQATNKA